MSTTLNKTSDKARYDCVVTVINVIDRIEMCLPICLFTMAKNRIENNPTRVFKKEFITMSK